MSVALVAAAADIAGEEGRTELASRILALRREVERIAPADPFRFDAPTPWDVIPLEERRRRASSPFGDRARGRRELALEYLRGNLPLVTRKLETAGDPEALERWAAAREEGAYWAAWRLREIAPDRLERVLRDWISRADPELAWKLREERIALDRRR